MTWIDYTLLTIGLIGTAFCAIDYLIFKPRREERQRQLDLIYKSKVQKVFEKFYQDNIKH